MVQISKASHTEFNAVQNLMLTALREDPDAFTIFYDEYAYNDDFWWRNYLSGYLNQRDSLILLAKEGDKYVGMIGMIFSSKRKTSHVANVVWFYVLQEYRGMGIGKSLLKECLNQIDSMPNITKIALYVTETQQAAIEQYKANGFVVSGIHKDDLKIGDKFLDVLVMERFKNNG